jgi:xanthine/uracil permease
VPPAGDAIVKKPATLAYGLEELPPAVVTWISAVQHVGVCAIFTVYPLIIAHQAALPADQITNILQLAFLALAVAAAAVSSHHRSSPAFISPLPCWR